MADVPNTPGWGLCWGFLTVSKKTFFALKQLCLLPEQDMGLMLELRRRRYWRIEETENFEAGTTEA
jgi:hypothetical protein